MKKIILLAALAAMFTFYFFHMQNKGAGLQNNRYSHIQEMSIDQQAADNLKESEITHTGELMDKIFTQMEITKDEVQLDAAKDVVAIIELNINIHLNYQKDLLQVFESGSPISDEQHAEINRLIKLMDATNYRAYLAMETFNNEFKHLIE